MKSCVAGFLVWNLNVSCLHSLSAAIPLYMFLVCCCAGGADMADLAVALGVVVCGVMGGCETVAVFVLFLFLECGMTTLARQAADQ